MAELSTLGGVIKAAYEGESNTNAFTDAEKSKLAGIAENATANATDAELRNRATHTGTQDMSTITGLEAALEAKATTEALALLDARVAALEAATPEG